MCIKICIVSTKGGGGKTTLTANLGGILADLGQRVLLVDADLWLKPRQAKERTINLKSPHRRGHNKHPPNRKRQGRNTRRPSA